VPQARTAAAITLIFIAAATQAGGPSSIIIKPEFGFLKWFTFNGWQSLVGDFFQKGISKRLEIMIGQ
jgi:hypothetical protein